MDATTADGDGSAGEDRATVGVVGAGITGLALTHYLAEHGVDSVTFEASAEPGGVIQSRHVDGRVLEVGPQRMRKTPGIAAIAEDVGVADDIIEAREEDLYVYANGDLGKAPLSIDAFLETDLLSWRGKARMLAEPLTREGMEAETAEGLFVRKFGREAYERFIGPLYGGIYGSDPARMPAAYALEGLLEREREAGSFLAAFRQRVGTGQESPPITFREGNQQLPEAIYAAHADRIELETPVTDVTPLGAGAGGAGAGGPDHDGPYVLETSEGAHQVDHVVVTTPASVASDLLSGIADGAEGLDGLLYNPLALVFLESAHERTGKGYQVGYGEDLHTLGVSWNGRMFGRNGVQTVFLGGMHEPELVEEPDDRLAAIAREEFERVMGAGASVIDVARLDVGFPAWDQSWWNLENLDTPAGVTLATNYTARMGIPSRVREARGIAERLAEGAASESADALAATADD
ncbi:protoporphyrinogen oxidase [Halobacteriales archaeon SW_10_66_29]|nr:MAG: protoporphyrinogen oxidase [Halobacteriales archaeon SW_10_66_29]